MADRSNSNHRSARRTVAMLIAAIALFAAWIWGFLLPRRHPQTSEPAVAEGAKVQRERPGIAFEPSDWNIRIVATVYVGILILLVLTCFVLIAAYPNALPDVARTVGIAPPGPRLQTNPSSELKRVRASEEKKLNTYYWVDKSKGLVHVPIAQAMRKLATSGIPGFGKGPQQ